MAAEGVILCNAHECCGILLWCWDFSLLLAAPLATAQVAVADPYTSTALTIHGNGHGNRHLQPHHGGHGESPPRGGRLDEPLGDSTGTMVTGVTYNGIALISIGSHNDTGNTRRVEMWYLLAPINGNHNVAVTVNIPTAGTVALSAGATTFTNVDQTVPLGTFVSADGATGANSQLDVPSVVNGMVMDTLGNGRESDCHGLGSAGSAVEPDHRRRRQLTSAGAAARRSGRAQRSDFGDFQRHFELVAGSDSDQSEHRRHRRQHQRERGSLGRTRFTTSR